MSEDCIFCKIAAGELDAQVVHRDDGIVAFRDINPQAPTHVVIIPKEHIETINDLKPNHAKMVGNMILAAKKVAADDGLADDGYRLVFNCQRGAGQSVWHIHLHVLGGRQLNWPPG